MRMTHWPWGLCALLCPYASAAGLTLTQIATADSVGSAGVDGVTNRRDSSSVITNPAGMVGMAATAYQVGLEYLDVNQRYEDRNSGNSLSAGDTLVVPHLSYVRPMDGWTLGAALHAPGGIGLSYSDGYLGGGLVDSSEITVVNGTLAAAVPLTESLSMGGSLILQYARMAFVTTADNEQRDSDVNLSLAVGFQYRISDQVLVGYNYNHRVRHQLSDLPDEVINNTFEWPSMMELGVRLSMSPKLALMARINHESWSDFGDSFDRNYDNTFGGGLALSYQFDGWRLIGGVHFDESPIGDPKDRTIDLPLDETLKLGLGMEWSLSGGRQLGLGYQYMDMGDAEVGVGGRDYVFATNEVHFLTLSFRG